MLCDQVSPGDMFITRPAEGYVAGHQAAMAMVLDIDYTSLGPRYKMYVFRRDGTIRTEVWTIHTLEKMEMINEGRKSDFP